MADGRITTQPKFGQIKILRFFNGQRFKFGHLELEMTKLELATTPSVRKGLSYKRWNSDHSESQWYK